MMYPGSMGRRSAAREVVFALCAVAIAGAASPQTPPSADGGRLEALAKTLADGVSCTGSAQRDALDDRAKKSGALPADVSVALAILSSSNELCAPVRTGASALNAEYAAKQAQALQAAQASADDDGTQRILDNVAIEAEVRAASTRFDVGPPPRNLTQERISRP